jgi:tRNA pseudouridine55 synthase
LLPHFPSVTANAEQLARIVHGNAVNLPLFSEAGHVKVFGSETELVAVAVRLYGTLYQPKVVFRTTARKVGRDAGNVFNPPD